MKNVSQININLYITYLFYIFYIFLYIYIYKQINHLFMLASSGGKSKFFGGGDFRVYSHGHYFIVFTM